MNLTPRCLLSLVAGLAACSPLLGDTRVLLVGVNEYFEDLTAGRLLYADKDARLVAAHAARRAGAKAGDIHTLVEKTDYMRVQQELIAALFRATPQDTVVLFISAHGTARPEDRDGFVHVSRSARDKLESTAIPISEIETWIRNSPAGRVIVFADLSRQRSGPTGDNSINMVLSKRLGGITKPAVAGVLGSLPRQYSEEDPGLRFENEAAGFGVFGYSLTQALLGRPAQPGGAALGPEFNIEELAAQLRKAIARLSHAGQQPLALGTPESRRSISLKTSPGAALGTESVAWFAAMRLGSRIAAFQMGMPCFLPAELADPKQLAARLESAAEDCRMDAAMTLADEGQKYVVRYGLADFLPDDPLRLQPKDFVYPAACLRGAAKLLGRPQDTPIWDPLRKKILARAMLCEGLAGGSLTALQDALGQESPPIPEIENAIGAYYLERGGGSLALAAEHFKKATRLSPHWVYPKHNLALTQVEFGDYRAAQRTYEEAILVQPWQPYLYYNLGLVLQRTNRLKPAMTAYETALIRYRDAITVLDSNALAWKTLPMESGLAKRRADIFRRNQAEVHNAIGSLHQQAGRFDPALTEYKAAGAHCAARHNRAMLTLRLNRRGEAAGLLEENVADKGCAQFFPSRLELANLRLAVEPAAAADLYRSIPKNYMAEAGLAKVDRAQNNFTAAIDRLTGLVSRQEKEAGVAAVWLYQQLAETYEASGLPDSTKLACQGYRKAERSLSMADFAGDRSAIVKKARQCPVGELGR